MPLLRRAREFVAEMRTGLENPDLPLTSTALVELFGGQRTDSGIYVNEETAHRIIAVYRAHSLLGGTLGSLPLRSFTGEAPGGKRWAGREAKLLAAPGGIDDRGNPMQGTAAAVVFYETMIVHMMSWGNAYIVKHRDGAGRVSMLDLLLPNRVQPRWTARTTANPAGKEFWILNSSGLVEIATPKDVIHIPAMGKSLLQGMSPIGMARQALGLSVAAEQYGARLFGSGNLMAGILSTDQRLRQGDADRLRDRWRDKMNGLATAHDVAVMDAGAKWQSIGIPPEDSQFIQTRQFAVEEIARLYGIPPHMLGQVTNSTSWGTGIEQQSLGFNIYTLRPWVTRIEQTLSNELLPRNVNARFNVGELLRGDAKTEVEAHQIAVMSGQETIDEAREARGLPPTPGGNVAYFPSNYVPLQALANAPAPALPGEPGQNNGGGQFE